MVVGIVDIRAHHIRGLPHYSYKNNYPETPVYEVVENAGPWIVTFTYYQIPGQKALDLAIYIRDEQNSEVYAGPVTFLVFGKHEDPGQTHPFVAYRNPTNIYKVGWIYEDDGDYYIRVTFSDEANPQNVLFAISVGGEYRVWYVLGGSVLTVLIFAAIIGLIRRKQMQKARGEYGNS